LRLVSSLTLSEQKALIEALMQRRAAEVLGDLYRPQDPSVRRAPRRVRGFQVRLDLRQAKPPIWRRLILPGDLTLDQVHLVIQAAMGWHGYHLHRFRMGVDHRAPYFITEFDLEEGEQGVLENDVRLDQIVAAVGDALSYEYDFGDGWDHILKVEKVLPNPPFEAELVTGRRACPPEDIGGIGDYTVIADWVENDFEATQLPEQFHDVKQAIDWLPADWHPATFDRDLAGRDVKRALLSEDDEHSK